MQGAPLQTFEQVKNYATAGRAVVTIVSRVTQERVTLKIKKMKDNEKRFFVNVRKSTEADDNNWRNWSYIGVFDLDRGFWTTSKTNYDQGTGIKAAAWFLSIVANGDLDNQNSLMEQADIWHEGRCGRCSKELTVPESIAQGLGPTCAGRIGR